MNTILVFTYSQLGHSANLLICPKLDSLSLASLWPVHRTKGWPILVSFKVPTLSHTHRLGQLLGLFKLHLWFLCCARASLKSLTPNSSFTTGFSCGSAFRPPAHKAGTSSASWCGTWWFIPWGPVTFSVLLAETRKQNNLSQCAVTTDWLTGLLRKKHLEEVIFRPASLQPPCQGKHCFIRWTLPVASPVFEC